MENTIQVWFREDIALKLLALETAVSQPRSTENAVDAAYRDGFLMALKCVGQSFGIQVTGDNGRASKTSISN